MVLQKLLSFYQLNTYNASFGDYALIALKLEFKYLGCHNYVLRFKFPSIKGGNN